MSEMMSSDEIARLQDDIEAYLLPDTCNILSPSRVPDGQGGWTDNWGTATAAVKCRVDGMANTGEKEVVHGASLRDYATWIVTLPHDTTLQSDWRIEHNTHTYAIISLYDDDSWPLHVRATMERL